MPKIKVRVLIVRNKGREVLRFEGGSRPLDAIEQALKDGVNVLFDDHGDMHPSAEFQLTTYVVEREEMQQ